MAEPAIVEADLDTGYVAVQAHRLLNGFAVTAGRAATLRSHWDAMPEDTRRAWLAEMERTAVEAGILMRQLAVGQPVDIVDRRL